MRTTAILLAATVLVVTDSLAQKPRAAVVRQPQRAIAAPKIPVIRGEGPAAPREDLVEYQAVDMSPAQFSITANHPEHKAWKFYSCEITPLK